MESPDMIQRNIEEIGKIFPSCITERKDKDGNITKGINFGKLQELLSGTLADEDEVYEFTWVGKQSAVKEAYTPIRKTLRPCPEESADWDNTGNLYIEGDNLEVLKLLQENYLNKVKMIYIDPPYNTGNDFIYNDTFRMDTDDYEDGTGYTDDYDERMYKNTDTNGQFHSDWCSMIYSRLLLARTLLSEDGVIFISIDDNELDNLMKICNELFGENNFVGCISRATGTTTGQDANKIGSSLDYCIVYSKSSQFILNGIDMEEKDKKRFNEVDSKGYYSTLQLRKTGNADRKEDRPNMFYAIEAPDGSKVYPFGPSDYLSRWRVSKESYNQLVYEDKIVWKQNLNDDNLPIIQGFQKSSWTPYVKYYLEGRTKQVSNLFQDVEGNKKASIILKNIFGTKGIFDNPKPLEFLIKLLKISTDKNAIAMDFFSGSGTTAHAVMQLNAEDGGKRKFIMVQLPEKTDPKSEAYKAGYKNICEIGKERIRRAGKKIKEENPLLVKDLDTGFRVFKVDSTNMEDIYYSPFEINQNLLFESNIKPDRNDLDLLFGCVLDWGLTLDMPYKCELIDGHKVYTYADGSLMACFEENITERMIDEIISREPMRVLFRDSCFKNDCDKLSVVERFKLLAPEIEFKVI